MTLHLVLRTRGHQEGQGMISEETHLLNLWGIHPETAQETSSVRTKLMLPFLRWEISSGERKSPFGLTLAMVTVSTGN